MCQDIYDEYFANLRHLLKLRDIKAGNAIKEYLENSTQPDLLLFDLLCELQAREPISDENHPAFLCVKNKSAHELKHLLS